jgi:arabinogalactan endo-1,4-beta-galactosidase
MKHNFITKSLVVFMSTVMVMSLTACGGKNKEKTEDTVASVEWDDGTLSDEHASDYSQVADIFVNKIDGMTENLIKGMDVSSLISEENSGVVYHDKNGDEADLLAVLADAGFNYIRVRVWNDPFDSDGNGYGGGNCDLENCKAIGIRAAEYGMKVLVDFQYSDFWADPDKQFTPKAWENMTFEAKTDAIYEYTKESLQELIDAGVDVGMVQIGNETNSYFCGEENWINITTLMNSAAKAIREVDKDIYISLHFTDPERVASYENYLMILDNYDVDYDIFATSYYPYWHGTLENLTEVLSVAANQYGKLVMVAETSYAYDVNDQDGWTNTIGTGSAVEQDYSYSVQGQATEMHDVMEAVVNVGDNGIGCFYWEGAWITVPVDDDMTRQEKWEQYGSGWASSYSVDYDPDDAGIWYGGNSVENQALFDQDGYPLSSLYTWEYCYTGAVTSVAVDMIKDTEVTVRIGDEIELPSSVEVTYNDGSSENWSVTWDEFDPTVYEKCGAGKYPINGTVKDGTRVKCVINLVEPNYVDNYSFEDDDESMWEFDDRSEEDDEHELYLMEKVTDSYTGVRALHWYSKNYVDFDVTQKITDLKPGVYKMSATFQGGDSINQDIYIYCETSEDTYKSESEVSEYRVFRTPTIDNIVVGEDGVATVGIHVYSEADGNSGPWGTVDDVLLNPVDSGEDE